MNRLRRPQPSTRKDIGGSNPEDSEDCDDEYDVFGDGYGDAAIGASLGTAFGAGGGLPGTSISVAAMGGSPGAGSATAIGTGVSAPLFPSVRGSAPIGASRGVGISVRVMGAAAGGPFFPGVSMPLLWAGFGGPWPGAHAPASSSMADGTNPSSSGVWPDWWTGPAPAALGTFKHSRETLCRNIIEVLNCLMAMCSHYIRPIDSNFSTTHPRITSDNKMMPFFKDCIGVVDGTHMTVVPPPHDVIRCIGRSGKATQNILGVVDFDLRFTYVSIG